MKKLSIITTLFAFTFFIFSCSKKDATNSATATYYIKGKKDGTAFNFTSNTMAKITDFSSAGGFKSLNLLAYGSGMEGFNIDINFFSGTAITTGTYSENDASLNYGIGAVYNPNSTTFDYAAGIQSPSVQPLVINIVSKTSTEITGTFSGAFYKQDLSSGTMSSTDHILITEGEFKLQVQ